MEEKRNHFQGTKEFIQGIITLIGAAIVTCLLSVGIIYTIIYLLITFKFEKFFVYLWQLIDGTLGIIGFVCYKLGYALDLLWCLWAGEMIEDMITAEEETYFRRHDITVSAAVGDLTERKLLNKRGQFLNRLLNLAFNEKHHAVYAIRLWRYLQNHKKVIIEKHH